MKIKKFYRTQREVAAIINEIVDEYWVDNLTDEELEENIIIIYKNNQRKIIKNDDFTTILKQQCGKNRLTVVENIITNQKAKEVAS
ncbi:TIGR04540 family protein [Aerococcus viridans]|uniref:Glycosyl transferase n=1 Tax=Aerococcus viridans TaxID=1377 RepID=A0A2J9PPS8_9LACT|nr:TIGR04540 family protein [Aerococcus viridans]PNL92348.1 glycosyl transferase [Aerococcus viridans]